ncbi:MAG: ABC transporter permease [Lachnospiraceae bacterium]|nr:ABC transporter permease [Lachnospiraceae bacterium]
MWKLFRKFLGLETKRALKILPQYYLGTALLVALFAAVALAGNAAMSGHELEDRIEIALVMQDTYLKNYGMDVLQSSASATSVFHFTEVSEEEAFAGLRDGRYDGCMLFPPDFITSVFSDGAAGAAKFYEPPMMNSLDQGLMEGLVEVGCGLIAVSSAYVAGAVDIAAQQGVDQKVLNKMQDEMELVLAARVINREDTFIKSDASGTGGQTLLQFYFCAGVVMLLMLGGVACGTLLKGDAKSLEDQLAMHGIKSPLLALARYLAVLILFLIFYTTVFLILYGVWLGNPDAMEKYFAITKFAELRTWYLSGLPILALAAALVLLVYTFAANQIGGILLLFLLTALMGYASGCIVPSAYLPKAVRSFGRYLPTYTMLQVSVGGLRQSPDVVRMGILLIEATVAWIATVVIMSVNRWREQR